MNKKPITTPEGCKDILGEPMYTGDFVAYSLSDHRELFLAKIIGWTPKRMKISDLNKKYQATDHVSNLEHHDTRFIKVPKLMIARLRMGFDLSEVNENIETEDDL